MPAIQAINLGELLPTFVPVGRNGALSIYTDESGPSVSTESTVTISTSRPSRTSKLFKARIKMVIPVSAIDPITSLPNGVKIHEASADVTFMFHEEATDAEKLEMYTNFLALLQTPVANEVITLSHSIY